MNPAPQARTRPSSPSYWRLLCSRSGYVLIAPRPGIHKAARPEFDDHRVLERGEQIGRGLRVDAFILIAPDEQVEGVIQWPWTRGAGWPDAADVYALLLTPALASGLNMSHQARKQGRDVVEIDWPPSINIKEKQSARDLFVQLTGWLHEHRVGLSERAGAPGTVIDLLDALRRSLSAGAGDVATEADVNELIGLRKNLRESVPMFTSDQWAQLRGVSSNPSAALAKYREQRRLFSVQVGRSHLYPQFQFDQHAAPRDVIAEVLRVVPSDAQGWALLSWFDAASSLLSGRKPRDVLVQDPAAVVEAARDFYLDD